MKIALYSDLHTEINTEIKLSDILQINKEVEMVILAGDIGNEETIQNVIQEINRQAPKAKILYVLGNHEYYRHFLWFTVSTYIKTLSPFKNVEVLENDVYLDESNKVAFIGATLWTDFELLGKSKKAMEICQNGLNDYRLIFYYGENNDIRPIITKDTQRLFKNSIKYIESVARKYKAEGYKICVITHHAPMREAIEQKYLDDLSEQRFISSAFASNISATLMDLVDVWCYGHTHSNMQYTHIAGTKIISNQFGYSNDNIIIKPMKEGKGNKIYHPDFSFEL